MDYLIGRYINGISLNGIEYVLDENDNLLKFDSRDSSIAYLDSQGIKEEQMESLGIFIKEVVPS